MEESQNRTRSNPEPDQVWLIPLVGEKNRYHSGHGQQVPVSSGASGHCPGIDGRKAQPALQLCQVCRNNEPGDGKVIHKLHKIVTFMT